MPLPVPVPVPVTERGWAGKGRGRGKRSVRNEGILIKTQNIGGICSSKIKKIVLFAKEIPPIGYNERRGR